MPEAWPLPEPGAIALTNMIKSSVKLPVRVSGAMALSKLAGLSLAAAAAEKSARSSAGLVLSTNKALGETGQPAVAGMKLAICGSLRADSLLIEAIGRTAHRVRWPWMEGRFPCCQVSPVSRLPVH
jgi:hypothetical protein